MDEKKARPQLSGKAQAVLRRRGLLELNVSSYFCGSLPLKRRRRERRPKYRTTNKASSNPALINSDMIETHTEIAPSFMKPSARPTAVANIQNIEVLIDVGEWKRRVRIEGQKCRKLSMTRTAKESFRGELLQGYDAFSLLSP